MGIMFEIQTRITNESITVAPGNVDLILQQWQSNIVTLSFYLTFGMFTLFWIVCNTNIRPRKPQGPLKVDSKNK